MADFLNPSAESARLNRSAESAQLQQKSDAVVPVIEQLTQKCKDKPAGLIQPTVDAIVEMCIRGDLAFKRKAMGRNCGIHKANRAATGADPFNAQNLALKMSLQGVFRE